MRRVAQAELHQRVAQHGVQTPSGFSTRTRQRSALGGGGASLILPPPAPAPPPKVFASDVLRKAASIPRSCSRRDRVLRVHVVADIHDALEPLVVLLPIVVGEMAEPVAARLVHLAVLALDVSPRSCRRGPPSRSCRP